MSYRDRSEFWVRRIQLLIVSKIYFLWIVTHIKPNTLVISVNYVLLDLDIYVDSLIANNLLQQTCKTAFRSD